MREKMNTNGCRKQENLRLVPITRSADELAQLELVEGVNKLALRTKKPRRFHKLAAAEAELKPLRLLGRITDDAVRAGCSEAEWLQAVMPVVGNLIRRKFRRTRLRLETGEAA